MKNTVFILRGLPGSGKTDFAFDLFEAMGSSFSHCSADNYMTNSSGEYHFDPRNLQLAHHRCKTDFTIALEENVNCIVVDNTNVASWEFEKYQSMAIAADYRVVVLIVENRRKGVSIHDVPVTKIEDMRSRFEVSL